MAAERLQQARGVVPADLEQLHDAGDAEHRGARVALETAEVVVVLERSIRTLPRLALASQLT